MNKRLYFLLIIILLVTSNSSNAQKLTITDQSKSALSLELKIDDYDIKEINDGKEILHEVALSSIMIPNDKGKPNLPSVNRFIAVPNNAKAKVIVNNYKKEILKNINIAPSRGIVSEYDTTNSDYIKDSDIYSKDELFPANIVSITEDINLRGVEAIGLNISPVQYNPVKKELIVYTEIELSIEYEGGDSKFGDDRLRSMHWDPILQHNILNYNSLPEINYSERFQQWIADDAEGTEYLIIIPDDESFREDAQRLADYRSKQGIITKVYSLNEMNAHSPEEIRDWFVDAYNNWEIAPVAVCLLGDYSEVDSQGIPAFHFYFQSTDPYISDRPYSDIDEDFLPDLTVSRLSASNEQEAKILVDKQIDYEFNNPVMESDFYEKPIMTSAYQQTKWFQISAESINGYLSSIGKDPYRLNVIYYYSDDYDDEIWSSANNTDQVVNYFGPNGLGYIPATPGETGSFVEYDNYELELLDKISQEPGYILQNRDHGWYSFWDCPTFESRNVPSLTNHGKLPFVLSINCATGAFDKDGCLTEALMRNEDKGAVGVIAATYETYTYNNDVYLWGVWDFFENDFLPDYGTSVENNNNYMPAFASSSAKHFMFQRVFPNVWNESLQETSNLFNAHCDAFLRLYSEVPQQMEIVHDDIYYNESGSFNIKAPHGSVIGISTDEGGKTKTLALAEGTGNMQVINIPNTVIPGNKLYVTVTKPNHLRYEKDVVISTDEAFIMMYDFNLYEDSQEITLNQDTYLDLKLRNIGKEDASSVNLSLSCDNDLINITNNNNIVDIISADEIVNVEDAFHLDIVSEIPNGSTITFTLNIEHDGTNHEEKFEVSVNSYNFEIINIKAEETEGDGNGFIDPGEYAKFVLSVENDCNYKMENIVANLISNTNFIKVVSEDIDIPSLNIGEKTDIEFEFYIEWNINPEPVPLTLEFDIEGSIIRHDFEKLLGTLAENFEFGVLENDLWQNDFNNPWYIDSNEAHGGDFSLRSGNIGDDSNTQISITLETFSEQVFSFYYKVSSENDWDYFYFYIDGEQKIAATGETGWKYAEYLISKGTHTYTWIYQKDFMVSEGSDCVWVDDIIFPCSSFTTVEETIDENIVIYPNPTKDFINIKVKDFSVETIEIYNNAGVKVLETDFMNRLDISHLSPGLYIVNLIYKNKNHIKKMVIE